MRLASVGPRWGVCAVQSQRDFRSDQRRLPEVWRFPQSMDLATATRLASILLPTTFAVTANRTAIIRRAMHGNSTSLSIPLSAMSTSHESLIHAAPEMEVLQQPDDGDDVCTRVC